MCIDPHQTGFIGKGSDHLQLIKFWPSRAPGEGGLRQGETFWLRLTIQPARSVCVSLSAFSCYSVNVHTGVGTSTYGSVPSFTVTASKVQTACESMTDEERRWTSVVQNHHIPRRSINSAGLRVYPIVYTTVCD